MKYFLIGKNWKHAYPIGVRVFFRPEMWYFRRNYYPETNVSIYDIGPIQITLGGND